METARVTHALTDAERWTFERDGYLILPDVLSPDETAVLRDIVDERFAAAVEAGADPTAYWVDKAILEAGPALLDLLDHPVVFPKIWGVLGWNIFLYHVRATVVPPSGADRQDKTLGFHQDSGRPNFDDLTTHPRPRLSMKAAWFLSDTTSEGCGNFWIVPGSHTREAILPAPGETAQPPGAIAVRAPAGSVVLFDRRLWHAASTNWSDVPRRVLFYGYGYRWMRQRDDHLAVPLIEQTDDPIRKQLLGHVVTDGGYYVPQEADVPLKTWLAEHHPEAAT